MSDKSRLENNNLRLENITNTVMNMPDYIEIKNQDKTININGIYNADSGYTGLGTVTVNVPSGSGDVKLFDTVEHMQADQSPSEGDLAVVYRSEIQIGEATFDGLYQYKDDSYDFAKTQLSANKEYVYNGVFYGPNGVENGALQNTENLSKEQLLIKTNIYSNLSSLHLMENITNLSNLYSSGYNLTSVPNIDTSNVTDISYMFYACRNLTTVPNYDTSNVTNMCRMFAFCNNLTTVPNFNTSNVTNMCNMFSSCYDLTSVPNYDTSNVTDISYMFSSCYSLTSVPNYDTSNVTDMRDMFYGCRNLTTVPNYDTSNVTDMRFMFSSCYGLTSVPNYDTSNVTEMYNMFYGCNNLSNSSIETIVNMCLTSNITNTKYKNLRNTNSYSPLYGTKFNSTYYSNRLTDLRNAGWTY